MKFVEPLEIVNCVVEPLNEPEILSSILCSTVVADETDPSAIKYSDEVPPDFINEVAFISPETSSSSVGSVSPIPTLPSVVTATLVVPSVCK